jgi:hypothetical protein
MSLANDLLVVAVGTLTGASSFIEIVPGFGATLNGSNETRMVFETHAVTVAQDAVAVWATLLLLGRAWQATDILATFALVVVAIGVTHTATRRIGCAVSIVTASAQRGLIDMLISPVVIEDGDGATVV